MKPAPCDETVVYATQALFAGVASESQQKAFMEWLLFTACHIGKRSFDPESERLSIFREGERHIGIQVARMRPTGGAADIGVDAEIEDSQRGKD